MCGSRRVRRRETEVHLRDGTFVIVEAGECSSCGEKHFDPDAIDQIRHAREKRPGRAK
jgi:YgiT-type zinc finger domain-containing protein